MLKGNNSTTNKNIGFKIDPQIETLLSKAAELLKSCGLDSSVNEILQLSNEVAKNRFTVSVVGEFSKGKSTFINKMFNKDFLPVANSPTTAMLTRIRYNPSESLIISDPKGKKVNLPLSEASWDGFVADIDGNEPAGVAFVGMPDPWLQKGIEIIDTPGAGDLEEKRTRVIGDALRGSDGAIITISAEQALSLSEKLFIEERLISKKVPFLMLIVTKLDRIPVGQRAGIIKFIKTKLEMWKVNVPIYVPYEIDIPGDEDYSSIIGMDKVKAKIDAWISDPKRTALTNQWIALKVISILQAAINLLNEKLLLSGASDAERDELIKKKQNLISNAETEWASLKNQMLERCTLCCQQMDTKISEFTQTITERMQYEVSRCGNPQKWWNQDFPYRIKIELTSMSSNIENSISAKIAEDSRWLNLMLERNFHTNILFSQQAIMDKQAFSNINIDSNVEFEDLAKRRNAAKIGLSVLSIAGYALCLNVGALPIIATTGISTVGGIATEGIFKKKTEQQADLLKIEILKIVPNIIKDSMKNSQSRVKNIYNDIINEATKQEHKWLAAQKDTISQTSSSNSPKSKDSEIVNRNIDALHKISDEFDCFLIK